MPEDNKNLHDVCVVGLGYIGLPTALVLATHGIRVHGADTNKTVVKQLSSGKVTINEPGIQELLTESLDSELLSVSGAPRLSGVHIVAVPTPLGENRSADLSYVFDAVDAIIPTLQGGELIILESTCPPGTTSLVAEHVVNSRPD